MHISTATAPVNIATLKYWGKRDVKLNLPTNSSISVTLSQDDLRATTTARADASFSKREELILNGTPEPIGSRAAVVLSELRRLRHELEAADSKLPKIADLPLLLVSENNFPTAAGLASSAAGFAAMVSSVAQLYALPHSPSELSVLARQGSGSACRSLFGGYVAWEMGTKSDGSDSLAVQIAPVEHWPEMRALILVVSSEKKAVSSSSGMQTTVATSSLFKERINHVVPARFKEMSAAILARDFPTFAELTMKDSNQFHAVCLDSSPPIFYMNDVSRASVRAVEEINRKANRTIAAYTFDAGPNCVVYYQEKDEKAVVEGLRALVGVQGFPGTETGDLEAHEQVLKQGISRVIKTSVGDGPRKCEEHLSYN